MQKNTPLVSSINPVLIAYTSKLKENIREGFRTRECDYSVIMSLALSQYFKLNNFWCIAPEFALQENYHPDYLVSYINTNRNNNYGVLTYWLLAEIKNHGAISWWNLMQNQLWNQADAAKNAAGKFWVIGQIGFEVCFFKFDVLNYPSHSDKYTNFEALNLNNLTTIDLDLLNAKYLTESNPGTSDIRVIKWRWDNPDHHVYIEAMFNHVSSNAA